MTGTGLTVVMFVRNDVRRDSRVLREAKTLADAGHTVTVVGRTDPSAPQVVEREDAGGFAVVRVPGPNRWYRRWQWLRHSPWRLGRLLLTDAGEAVRARPPRITEAVRAVATGILLAPWAAVRLALHASGIRRSPASSDDGLDWLLRWRFGSLAWARRAAATAPPADVYHGHDLSGLPAAVDAATRTGARVVYDSHEYFLESGTNAARPRWAKAILDRMERRLASKATALVTVNRTLAALLEKRLRLGPAVVVHNCPPRWTAPPVRPDRIREATGIASSSPIVLYHGGFAPDRGLFELVDAIRRPGLEDAHLVFLGFGPLEGSLRAVALDAASGGRVHVLPAVPPAELDEWVASADVGAMPNLPRTANERLSTPNKLFESLAVGLPVVSSDFPERRRIVADDPDGPLGALCDPTDIDSIAAALLSILELPATEREALRARCLKAAHERWNWETESAQLVALYAAFAVGA